MLHHVYVRCKNRKKWVGERSDTGDEVNFKTLDFLHFLPESPFPPRHQNKQGVVIYGKLNRSSDLNVDPKHLQDYQQ